ncbi:MAG: hypothetical protein ACLFPX_07265 [Candidatus Omnitrophota bacterium]
MKKVLKTMTALSFALALTVTGLHSAQAKTLLGDYLSEKDIDVSVSATMDYYSKYVWRGMLLDDDNVLQPGLEVSVGGLTAGFWASWDIESEDGLNSDEVDGYLDYTFDLGALGNGLEMVSMSVGHTWYTFPEADLNAQEYYAGLSFDTFLSPSVTWYHDYSDEGSGGADGDYIIGSVGYSVPLSEEYGISLDLAEEVGYNDGYFIAGEGGYSLSSVGLSLPLKEGLDMGLTAAYSVPFGDLEDDDDGNHDNEFYYGVSLAFSF